jgi:hypothetical protein
VIRITLSAARLPQETIRRPLALRPSLTTGLPLSRMKRLQAYTQKPRRSDKYSHTRFGGEASALERLAAAPARLTQVRLTSIMELRLDLGFVKLFCPNVGLAVP